MARPEKQMRDHWIAEATHKAWKETGLTIEQTFLRYRFAGGQTGMSGVKSWLYGWTIPDVDEYLTLASVLNVELTTQEKPEFCLPFFDRPSEPRGGDNGTGDYLDTSGYQANVPLAA